MIFTETKLKGAYLINLKRLEDERGFFARTFCQQEFKEYGLNSEIAQTNISYNKKRGTLRGLHMQLPPHEESKLIKCNRGAIYDIIVDLRKNSKTFLRWIGAELTSENHQMIYVPEGFAHGFITLEDNTEVNYQMNQFYAPGYEKGYRWNDPAFDIVWPIEPVVIAEKDKNFPLLEKTNLSDKLNDS
jgi:dTDP-4-dehydrorhamnose 3,5-epimerase